MERREAYNVVGEMAGGRGEGGHMLCCVGLYPSTHLMLIHRSQGSYFSTVINVIVCGITRQHGLLACLI